MLCHGRGVDPFGGSGGGDAVKPVEGGSRRVDRLLAEDFLEGLAEWEMAELRSRRREVEQEEADLSYIRRMLQGRVDIITAEMRRRGLSIGQPVVEVVADALSGKETARRSARHITVEPSRVGLDRRAEEMLASDVVTLDVESKSDEELVLALEALRAHEGEVSELRHRIHFLADALSTEVARRYRDGAASVDSLLGENL